MKLWLKRTLGVSLGASILLSSCLSCGSSDGEGKKEASETGLTLFLSSMNQDYYSTILEEYQTLYPEVELQLEVMPEADFNGVRSRMNAQLMAGEGPDILLIAFNYFDDVDKMMKAGVFAPLDPFLEADEEFNRTDYVESVLDVGVFDGTQYIMPLGYQYRLAITTQEIIDETGFDTTASSAGYFGFVEQMDKLYQNYPDRYVVATAGSLANFPNVMGVELFDYKNGKVLMDTPEIKTACEYYKNLYPQDNDNSRISSDLDMVSSDLASKKSMIYFSPGVSFSFELANNLVEAGCTPVLLSYPQVDGGVSSVCELAMAIRANSKNQQNAYNMIRLFLTEENQHLVSRNNLPVKRTVIHDVVSQEYEKYVLNDSGITEEFANQYEQLASSVKSCHFTNHLVVSDFVSGKMKPYFLGEKSYEECMKDFVDYAEIYLSE
ncbi:MAG: ABC transporter substrate-binding protein [Massiliimalia sp.]